MTYKKELVEKLAEYAHSSWSRWMDYLYSKSIPTETGVLIPVFYAERWSKQAITEYKDLTKQEKESDRKEAIKMLDIVKHYLFLNHAGDCSIFKSIENNEITDGICTCGYGSHCLSEGDPTKMYSLERLESLRNKY